MDRKKILYLVIAGILVVLLGKTYLQEQQQKKAHGPAVTDDTSQL